MCKDMYIDVHIDMCIVNNANDVDRLVLFSKKNLGLIWMTRLDVDEVFLLEGMQPRV